MKKRFYKATTWVLALAMIMTVTPCFMLPAFAAADLTDSITGITLSDSDHDGYYEIGTADELMAFANLVNDENDSIDVKLTDNIDMTGKEWKMIVYGGTIDGMNFAISNLELTATEVGGEQYAGLIYANGATVKDITFKNCHTVISSEVSSSGDVYAAIIAPVAIGGIFERCSLVDCTVTQSGTADGFSYAGSIAGLTAYGLKMTGCSVEGCTITDDSASEDGSFAGGLAGGFWADEEIFDFGVQVKNNTVDADVTAKNSPGTDVASGLISSVLDDSLAIVEVYDNCEVSGTIVADDVAAGLIGDCCGYDVTINDCSVLCDSITATYGDPFVYGEWAQKGEHIDYTATYSNLKIREDAEFVCNQPESSLGKYYLSDLYLNGEWDTGIVSFADYTPEPTTYTIGVTASPTEGGTVTGGGTYEGSASVTVVATAKEGYKFDGWYEDDIYKSSDASYTFTATENRDLEAKFVVLYTVTYHANNDTDSTDSERVADGETVHLPNDVFAYGRCEIEGWNTQPDGSGFSYSIGEDITVTGDFDLYAQWVLPLDELESFADDDMEWSGNDSSPYTFAMKNGSVLYASVVLPANTNEDKTTITAEGDCEIKGRLFFGGGTGQAGSNHKGDLTIKGNGTLTLYEMSSSGAGDTLTVETDVTIENGINIGASGGMNSKIAIKDATLTLKSELVLLQYLVMEGDAKLDIAYGSASFHGNPDVTMSDQSSIYIAGDGESCILWKEGGDNTAFDAWVTGNWLPEGFRFKEENGGYYLYDAGDILERDPITIKKRQTAVTPSSGGGGGGGSIKYILTYESNGGTEYDKENHSPGKVVEIDKEPHREGYVFDGWYADQELTTPVDQVKMTRNHTVYAKWVEDNGAAGNGHQTPGALDGEHHFAYVVGYPDGTVRPNDNIDRAEVTAIFFRLLKEEIRTGNLTDVSEFQDVAAEDWFNKAVATMAKLGIVKGRTPGYFEPTDYITRAEFAAICARFDDSEFEIVDEFTDVAGHWAEAEIHEAAAHGWIKGYEDGTFKPDQLITRAEAMTMINRVLNRIPETEDDLHEDMVVWPDNADVDAWYYLPVQEATNSHTYEMKNHVYESWTGLAENTDWTIYQ